MSATMDAVLQTGDGETQLRPFALDGLENEIRRLAAYPDSFAENAGLDLAGFLRDGDAFSAAMLAWSLKTLSSAMRRSAGRLENVGIDLEIRVMDALSDARLARQRGAA